jgi:hypothetical protein
MNINGSEYISHITYLHVKYKMWYKEVVSQESSVTDQPESEQWKFKKSRTRRRQ